MRRAWRRWRGVAIDGGFCYNIRMNKPLSKPAKANSLKIVRIGNSAGVILPKEVLARLRVELGDEIFLSESPSGFSMTAANPDFVAAMTAAEEIMREDREILAVLAR